MGNVIDLNGKKFGRLTVIQKNGHAKNGNALWDCLCQCGNRITVDSYNLRSGHTKSCGCYSRDMAKRRKNFNKYDLSGDIGIGYTSNTNRPYYFDKQDYDKIKYYCWSENDNGYAVAKKHHDSPEIRMHRLLLGLNINDPILDHINRNKLDNRKSNLRFANKSNNGINRGPNKNSSTGHKGVYLYPDGLYHAQIVKNGKTIRLGKFKTIDQAVKVRYRKQKQFFGEFAYNENTVGDR